MITITKDNFSLQQICDSGQCFRMRVLDDNRFAVMAKDRYIEVLQEGNRITFFCDETEYVEFWKTYFDLETDYSVFIAGINPNDTYLTTAAAVGSGVRILHQDLWEMIVTFLISQQNNIKRIKHCIELLCQTYGVQKQTAAGEMYYAFPEPKAFFGLPEDALMACNLGYRSKYVVRTANQIVSGKLDLHPVYYMTYPKARQELLKIFGVGEKVADCICLFALHHLEAFPVDTHIRQVLDAHYRRGFPNRRYKDCRGVMQQYIFYYDLQGGK